MDYKYLFVVLWGEVSSGSGDSVASFQCGSVEDLERLGGNPLEDWESYEDGAEEIKGVQVWDRSNDELTCILGRGNDLDSVSEVFFQTVKKNFSGHLGL